MADTSQISWIAAGQDGDEIIPVVLFVAAARLPTPSRKLNTIAMPEYDHHA
ncbi:MAG: hypothetical protein NVV73_15850 [Cellvibrionaceae bacterium]|nr:hypothetical protein [Cellvibrionaceae bacterium]